MTAGSFLAAKNSGQVVGGGGAARRRQKGSGGAAAAGGGRRGGGYYPCLQAAGKRLKAANRLSLHKLLLTKLL